MPDTTKKSVTEAGDRPPASGNGRSKLISRRIKLLVDLVIFAMLAAVMFSLKVVLAGLPNIEPVSLLVIVYTAVYRVRALIPIYIYVVLEGLLFGFSVYWYGYLYVWTILWLAVMLIPRAAFAVSGKWAAVIAPLIALLSGAFGLAFGLLMAPPQVYYFGFSLDKIWAWVLAGIPYDVAHACGNFAFGFAALPLVSLLKKLEASRAFK